MTIIKHYINNRWKWDFDGNHTAYDVVSLVCDDILKHLTVLFCSFNIWTG